MRKNQCDQRHETLGEIRLLPTGGDGNDILCFQCFEKEVVDRRARNEEDQEAGRKGLWEIPKWEDLKVYAEPTVPHVNKITVGCVAQKYDTTTRQCVAQEFIASDQVEYEDLNGEQIDWCEVPDEFLGQFDTHYYQPFNMVQPMQYCLIVNDKGYLFGDNLLHPFDPGEVAAQLGIDFVLEDRIDVVEVS